MRTGRLAGAAAAALAAAISLQAGHGQAPDQYGAATPADLSSLAPASAARSLDELAARFDQRAAIDLVRFMDGYWREAANAGFNATLDRIKARLEASGFAPRHGARRCAHRARGVVGRAG